MHPDAAEHDRWFVEHVAPHRPAVQAWLMARFPSLPDVDNVVQEAMARVFRARLKGPITAPRAHLFTTARNLALDTVRRQRVVRTEPITEATESFVSAEDQDVPTLVIRQEDLEVLTRAIGTLPERCRRVLTLRTAYGLTQKQIAQRLAVSESTVEKTMAQAIRGCADYFARGAGR
jgi:RNA polymerase sigma-70 factor (ECF subfamily)